MKKKTSLILVWLYLKTKLQDVLHIWDVLKRENEYISGLECEQNVELDTTALSITDLVKISYNSLKIQYNSKLFEVTK